jgi:hypothetical protein
MFAPVQLKGLIDASQRLMELLFEVVGPDQGATDRGFRGLT